MPKGSSIVFSPLTINRRVALWGASPEEFRLERWAGGEDEMAEVESNYGHSTSLARPKGYIGNMFAKVEFKRLRGHDWQVRV